MKSFFDQEGGVILNINHLHYFEEVCRQGSITKAAEVCHISQPSITAAINGLEKELGYKIFYRANNRLHLTDEGISFKELTSKFLNDFSDYYTQACDVADSKKARSPVCTWNILFRTYHTGFYRQAPVHFTEDI